MNNGKSKEELAKNRPRRGKRIISDKHARVLANKTVQQESFLNDTTINDQDLDESHRPPTMEEMLERHRRNVAERAAEDAAIGKTGKFRIGDPLPAMTFKMPARVDTSESESDVSLESEKENEAVNASMEKEGEADETTPIAQQRSLGLTGPPTATSGTASVAATPPSSRPESAFRRPALPKQRTAPRHSTPKVSVRHRDSLGTAFNNISIIANNSMHAPPTRKESVENKGPTSLNLSSMDEESENGEEVAPRNEAVEQSPAAAVSPPEEALEVEGEEREEEAETEGEEEEAAVQVHVETVSMSRQRAHRSPSHRDATMMSIGEEEERVEVVGVTMSRQPRPSLPMRDVTMRSMEEEEESNEEEGAGDEREESQEMEDVEMESVNNTPVRRQPIRPAKRSSFEHPLTVFSSPMAVQMARRSSGLREEMMRPKVSIQSSTNGRKISTGSVSSSIPLEELSNQNLSLTSSEQSYEDAKTPERTPRTNRLLRQSLAAREMRQSQRPQLAIVEETEMQGGESEGEEEEEEKEEETSSQRRVAQSGQRGGATTPLTPVMRVPRLSQKLQSSVDRLSQPRHRHDQSQPCARFVSPARAAPAQRPARPVTMSSPSPARRVNSFTSFNHTRGGIGGYTPNGRVDTTLMEDDNSMAKSGMATRIKRIPRREQGGGRNAAVLNVNGGDRDEEEDVEEERRARGRNGTIFDLAAPLDTTEPKDDPPLPSAPASTVTSPLAHTEVEESEEREDDEEEDEISHGNHSMASVGGASSNGGTFLRPADPLPATPRSANNMSRRSNASRRSVFSEGEGHADVDQLSTRASMISIGDDRRGAGRASVAPSVSSMHMSFDDGPLVLSPTTPFRRTVARNNDLFSTDTPGIDRGRSGVAFMSPLMMNTEEEEEWADERNASESWRGDVSTAEDENEDVSQIDDSQISMVEEEDANERVLAPRKLIAPTASPGVRRSTRTRMKPVRAWLGEQAQYELSPSTGARRLVGVNTVVIKDKLFVKTGTADIQKAVEANKKTAKQRGIANKKKREQRRAQQEEEDSD